MEQIYKTFFGKTINLSKIIAISDAEMYCPDGYTAKVGFTIDVELRDEPIIFQRELKGTRSKEGIVINDGDEAVFEWRKGNTYFQIFVLFDDGEQLEPNKVWQKQNGEPLAIKNLQYQINNLIKVWKEYKKQHELIRN